MEKFDPFKNISQEFKDECEENSRQIVKLLHENGKKSWNIRLTKIDNLCEKTLKKLQSKSKRKITKRRLKRKRIFLTYSYNGKKCWIEQKGKIITDIIEL